MRRLSPKERMKETIVWNEEDERNVAMLKVRNVRFLNLKNGKMTGANKVNVLEQFCRKNGLQEQKENWRKSVETEIELKEKEVEELNEKKKQAKSKKRKFEMFKECRAKLNSLIVDWKETLGKDEETSFGKLKESIEREKMDQVLGRHGRRMLRMLILLREDIRKKTTRRQLL